MVRSHSSSKAVPSDRDERGRGRGRGRVTAYIGHIEGNPGLLNRLVAKLLIKPGPQVSLRLE